MEWEDKLTLDDLERFRARHGFKSAQRILSFLGKNRAFKEALSTEVGQELLKDIILRMEVLLEKNIVMTITDEEKIEYKLLRGLLDRWTEKLERYNNALETLGGKT